jgi:hypothetical protein
MRETKSLIKTSEDGSRTDYQVRTQGVGLKEGRSFGLYVRDLAKQMDITSIVMYLQTWLNKRAYVSSQCKQRFG